MIVQLCNVIHIQENMSLIGTTVEHYEVYLRSNGTGSINVLFYLTIKFYMSPSK